jgi:hypothetical protein
VSKGLLQIGCHEKSHRKLDLFSIPDGLTPKIRIREGQIEFVGRSPQVLVDFYKDGCAEFYGLVCGVIIIWINCGASFKGLSHEAERNDINYGSLLPPT